MTTVPDLLARAAQQRPDEVALVEAATGRRVTWRELDAEADAVAAGLARSGMVAGYRVLLALTNRVELVTTYLGALRARLVAVPANPRAVTGEVLRIVTDSTPRMAVGDPATMATLRAAVAGVHDALQGAADDVRQRTPVPRLVAVDVPAASGETTYADLVAGPEPQAATPRTDDPDALAVLLYTSGTSGLPRAAMLSHRALLANIEQVARVEPAMVTGTDVVLGVLPLFHVYGLNAVLGQVVRAQARLVLVDGFDPRGSLEVIGAEAVTVVPVAPPVFAHWATVEDLATRLAGVRLVLSGSAPLAPHLVDAFTATTGIPVHQGYGLTEAAPVVTSTLCSGEPKRGSVGSALPGVSLRLRDEGGRAPEGADPGEIHVAGANLFDGYWPDAADGPDAEGWYATGDVGFLDADGDLFLVDRLTEVVIVSGFNVYPTEVEDVVAEVDGVAEAAVLGVEDVRTGEAVHVYVRRAASCPVSDEELVEQVHGHAETRLARFKRPREVVVVDELPHTVTGKVAKQSLRSAQRRRTTGLLE